MKYLFLILAFTLPAQGKESSVRTFRFVEASSIHERAGLPPKLEMVLEILCNEELAQVIRFEKAGPKTHKVTVAIGALVQENPLSSCAGEKRKLTVDAGAVFSGREYEIVRIKNSY